MTAIAEQDVKHMVTRIEALEALVQQQKDFMAESATTWRNLLEKEQTLLERGWREREQLDERFQLLTAQQATHANEIANLQMQITQSRDQLRIAEQMLENMPDEQRHASQIDTLKTENEDIRAQLNDENLRADKAEKEAGQARRDNAEAQDRLTHMSEQLSKLSNVLRQRQEEIEQAWAELVIHRQRVADLEDAVDAAAERENALEQKLKDANRWVFKLSGERAEQEKRLGALTREHNDAVKKLATAQRQVSSLRNRLDLLVTPSTSLSPSSTSRTHPEYISSSSVRPPNATHDERAMSTPASGLPHAGRVSAATSPSGSSSMAVEALLQPVAHRDKKLLLDRLTMQSGDMVFATAPQDRQPPMPPATTELPTTSREKAPVQETVPAVMRMAVPSRNPQLERQLKAAEAQVAWLRSLALASLAKPSKWTFMPLSWHLLRISGRFKRKGLFDEQSYLSRYPDVADSGMDPLIHYLKHGMDEERER